MYNVSVYLTIFCVKIKKPTIRFLVCIKNKISTRLCPVISRSLSKKHLWFLHLCQRPIIIFELYKIKTNKKDEHTAKHLNKKSFYLFTTYSLCFFVMWRFCMNLLTNDAPQTVQDNPWHFCTWFAYAAARSYTSYKFSPR